MILQRPSELAYKPQRIISLVPSQTELLFQLGLESETVGITKFCVHPKAWFHSKTRVGGTKTVNLAAVKDLKPDLIIANKEENVQEQVEELAAIFPVWVTDVNDLKDALQMINDIGELTGKTNAASQLEAGIRQQFSKLKTQNLKLKTPNTKLKTAYFIWRDPYMAAGGDTFIHDMLTTCGFTNIYSNQARYPEVAVSELISKGCELLLLSSEPYPFKQKHIDELAAQLPSTKIILVDGEMFSWYGSRMLQAAPYFQKLLNSIGK